MECKRVLNCPTFTNNERSIGVFVPYKCTLSSHLKCAGANNEILPDNIPLYGVVRHPQHRLESFIRDKLWENYNSETSIDARTTLKLFLSEDGIERLEAGRVTLEDVIGALEKGIEEWHTVSLDENIPEGATILKMEDSSTYETLSDIYQCDFPHENKSKKTPIFWSPECLERFYKMRGKDFERFDYKAL